MWIASSSESVSVYLRAGGGVRIEFVVFERYVVIFEIGDRACASDGDGSYGVGGNSERIASCIERRTRARDQVTNLELILPSLRASLRPSGIREREGEAMNAETDRFSRNVFALT